MEAAIAQLIERVSKLEEAVVELQRTQVILDTSITLARWLGPFLVTAAALAVMVLK